MEMQTDGDKEVVLLTGFGPFRHYVSNPSWELVQRFAADDLSHFQVEDVSVNVVTYQLPVSYAEVDRQVPALIETHRPLFAVHCGVSHLAESITLEKFARRYGYSKSDVSNLKPCGGLCHCPALDSNQTELWTHFDVDALCNCAKTHDAFPVASTDAGQYLCEYLYFSSLFATCCWSLFVHIPDYHRFEDASILDFWTCQLTSILKAAAKQRFQNRAYSVP